MLSWGGVAGWWGGGVGGGCVFFFFQAEDGIRDVRTWLEFRRVLFRSLENDCDFDWTLQIANYLRCKINANSSNSFQLLTERENISKAFSAITANRNRRICFFSCDHFSSLQYEMQISRIPNLSNTRAPHPICTSLLHAYVSLRLTLVSLVTFLGDTH